MVIYWWRYRRAANRGELAPRSIVTSKEKTTPHNTTGDSAGSTSPAVDIEGQSLASASEGRNFTLFIYALLLAYVAVLIRCIYR